MLLKVIEIFNDLLWNIKISGRQNDFRIILWPLQNIPQSSSNLLKVIEMPSNDHGFANRIYLMEMACLGNFFPGLETSKS